MKSTSMGSEGEKLNIKQSCSHTWIKCGILQKKLNRKYTDLPQWLKKMATRTLNAKCSHINDKRMRISRTRQYDIQVSNKVMW